MRYAYLALSITLRPSLDDIVAQLTRVCLAFGIELIVFTDRFQFTTHQEREMMQMAFAEIERCDLLIAKGSKKAIGIGIEAGYARGIGKLVWYMHAAGTAHSTTLAGTAQKTFVYRDTADMADQIRKELNIIT